MKDSKLERKDAKTDRKSAKQDRKEAQNDAKKKKKKRETMTSKSAVEFQFYSMLEFHGVSRPMLENPK